MRHASRIVATLLAGIGLACTACANSDREASSDPTTSQPPSTSQPSETTQPSATSQPSETTQPASAGRYKLVQKLEVPTSLITTFFAADDRGRVYLSAAPKGQDYDEGFGQLVEIDGHHRARTIARTAFPGGDIDSIATSRDGWVAWTDKSGVQGPGSDELRWRIWAKRIDSPGPPKLLASSGDRSDRFLPHVNGGAGGFTWPRPSARGNRLTDVWAWRPGKGGPIRVVRGLEVNWLSLTLEEDRLVYVGKGANGDKTAADCWESNLESGRRTAVSSLGRVMSCVAYGNHTVFTGHIPPKYTPIPADGYLDDPYTLWQKTGSEPVQLVEEGYIQDAPVVTGRHYMAWSSNGPDGIVYTPYGSTQTQKLGAPLDFADFTGNGDWIAVLMYPRSKNVAAKILMYQVQD